MTADKLCAHMRAYLRISARIGAHMCAYPPAICLFSCLSTFQENPCARTQNMYPSRTPVIATFLENPCVRTQKMYPSNGRPGPVSSRLFKRILVRERRKCIRAMVVPRPPCVTYACILPAIASRLFRRILVRERRKCIRAISSNGRPGPLSSGLF